MEQFIDYFHSMPFFHKGIWILVCILFGWLLEAAIPFYKQKNSKGKHVGINLIFLSSSIIINSLIAYLAIKVTIWVDKNQFGVIHWLSLSFWPSLVVSLLTLDFVAQWFTHFLLHKFKWGWKFHVVHHSDAEFDFSTGTRHHPGDYVLREVFSLLIILLFGIPMAFYVFYRMITIFFAYFTHSNVNLPSFIDKWLSYIIITPNAHKFHHHNERPWTDSNFGNVLSIWDRIFGTYVYDDPKKIVFGVDVVAPEKTNDFWYQLKLPFDPELKTDE